MADGEYSEVVNTRLRPAQKSLLDAAASMAGFDSRSEASRAVLMTWARGVFRSRLQDAMGGNADATPVEFDDETEPQEVRA